MTTSQKYLEKLKFRNLLNSNQKLMKIRPLQLLTPSIFKPMTIKSSGGISLPAAQSRSTLILGRG
jgi:hypothetical protein